MFYGSVMIVCLCAALIDFTYIHIYYIAVYVSYKNSYFANMNLHALKPADTTSDVLVVDVYAVNNIIFCINKSLHKILVYIVVSVDVYAKKLLQLYDVEYVSIWILFDLVS